jgi:hypothetical protein
MATQLGTILPPENLATDPAGGVRRRDLLRTLAGASAASIMAIPGVAQATPPQALAAIDGIDDEAIDPEKAKAWLARVEQIVDYLGDCYVCDGWHEGFDRTGAERTLAYFRAAAAGEPDDIEEWMWVTEWLYDHGQSLDWIMCGDPGGLICGVAHHSRRAASL